MGRIGSFLFRKISIQCSVFLTLRLAPTSGNINVITPSSNFSSRTRNLSSRLKSPKVWNSKTKEGVGNQNPRPYKKKRKRKGNLGIRSSSLILLLELLKKKKKGGKSDNKMTAT